MKYKTGQFFYYNNNLVCIPYDESQTDYYTFLKKAYEKCYRRVRLLNDDMCDFLRYIYNNNLQSNKIECKGYDDELEEEINAILKQVNANATTLSSLLEHIGTHNAIIKRIYVQDNDQDGLDFFLHENGMFGVDKTHFDEVSENILTYLTATKSSSQ